MSNSPQQFTPLMRILHWLMAVLVVGMLAIGVAMVHSLLWYHRLLTVHRPLGLLVLLLVAIRFVNRCLSQVPPLPVTMSRYERTAAKISEYLLYFLMFALPLVGWGMLSAVRDPIVLFASVHLPPILPRNAELYAILRKLHTLLAYCLLITVVMHLSAVLFHALILRDNILVRMAPWRASTPFNKKQ